MSKKLRKKKNQLPFKKNDIVIAKENSPYHITNSNVICKVIHIQKKLMNETETYNLSATLNLENIDAGEQNNMAIEAIRSLTNSTTCYDNTVFWVKSNQFKKK